MHAIEFETHRRIVTIRTRNSAEYLVRRPLAVYGRIFGLNKANDSFLQRWRICVDSGN
jgi:hypothetical protein